MDSHGYVMARLKAHMPESIAHVTLDAGLRFIEKMRQPFLSQNKTSDHNITKLYEEYYFDQFAKTGPSLFPNVLPTLQQLQQAGYLLAVATSMGRKSLEAAMQRFGLADFFSVTRCAEETAPKPNPMMLEEVLLACGLKAEQALMIGDTEADILMAQSIQMDSIAMTTGAHTPERLKTHGPLACLDDIQKLPEILKNPS